MVLLCNISHWLGASLLLTFTTTNIITALHHWPFVHGIHHWSVDSLHKGPVMGNMFSCHDVIKTLMVSCKVILHYPVLIHRLFPKESHSADLDEHKNMVRQLENGKGTSGMKLTSKETYLLITVWELIWWHQSHEGVSYIDRNYRKTSCISRTKSQNLNTSRLVMQLSLPNSLKPGVKSIMKM